MTPHPAIQTSVLDRLGDMRRTNTLAVIQVGDGAGELQDAVDGPGREAQAFEGGVEETAGVGLQDAIAVQVFGAHGGVGRGGAVTEALLLDASRGEDSSGDLGARLTGWAFELLETQGGNLDVQVDAVEQRAGDARPVALDDAGMAATFVAWNRGQKNPRIPSRINPPATWRKRNQTVLA